MKVFISRHINEGSPLLSLNDKADIEGASLISISPISFDTIPKSEWVYFYSSNGVRFFLEGLKDAQEYFKKIKVAVIGEGTANTFKKLVDRNPDFIGNGDKMKSIEFFNQITDTILFVKGSNSLESVERYLDGSRIKELVVYDNTPNLNIAIPDADIYVLTSPMNAEVYMNRACCRFNTKIIAIGPSTNNKLIEKGFLLASIPDTPSEDSIVNLLNKMLG